MIAALVAAAPGMVASFALYPNMKAGRTRALSSASAASSTPSMSADIPKKRVLVIGGTRFSGLYLTRELHARGHEVCFRWLPVALSLRHMTRESETGFRGIFGCCVRPVP